jgi:thiamine-phosphate pyrophosphorylase
LKALQDCLLYAFVDAAYFRGRDPSDLARQLCDGGADLIQFRAKDFTAEQIRILAEKLAVLTSAAGVSLVINDYPQIAADVGAPLCHLGQEDFHDFSHVGQVVPLNTQLKIGLSTHAPPQAERAIAAGAAYIAIGPVFPTGTKPSARPVTLEYVRWASSHVRLPWFAIGGITLDNLDSVLQAGARRICVVSAILCSDDVREACQKFKDRLLSARRDQTSF